MKIKINSISSQDQERYAHLQPILDWLINRGHEYQGEIDYKTHNGLVILGKIDVDAVRSCFELPESIKVSPRYIRCMRSGYEITSNLTEQECKESKIRFTPEQEDALYARYEKLKSQI